jgi:hypothetical protein
LRFYTTNQIEKNQNLFNIPFLVIDFSEIDDAKIEQFAQFHKNAVDNIKQITEEAQEYFFKYGFINALAEEFLNPSDGFLKSISIRMSETKRIDKDKLRKFINSNSINQALPKLIEEESKSGNIVITTDQELKIYHTVKTIIVNSLKKSNYSRISYRDQKNSFNILVDGNQRKMIARISSVKDQYFIEIGGNGIKIPANEIENIVALNKQIIELTKSYLEE